MLVALTALSAVALAPAWRRENDLRATETQGDEAFRAGGIEQARALWEQVLDTNPERPGPRNKLAVVHMNAGRFDEARALLETGTSLIPRNTSFHYNLGLLHAMRRDYDAALASLAEVERLVPQHGEVHFLKGVIYEKLGRDDLAEQEFIRELNVDPATPEAWARVARADLVPRPLPAWLVDGGTR